MHKLFQKSKLGIMMTLVASSALAQTNEEQALYEALEEVIVTAQFLEQNVQDTPIAVTAISGDTLDARGQSSTADIGAQAPNVTLNPGGAFAGPSLVAFIRGVGQTDFNPALEPGVGLYVDDVYYSTLTGSVLELLDLERVEVLRGPQGTLSGKNSIGGAIKLFSKRPDEENDGFIEASIGSYNAQKIRAASNFTLIEDELFARLSGVSNSRDGYIDRLSFGCVNPESGYSNDRILDDCKVGEDGDIDYSALRLALRWLPSDDLEVNFSIDQTDDNSKTTPNTLIGFGPTVAPVFAETGEVWPTLVPLFAIGNPSVVDPNIFISDDPYTSYATYGNPLTDFQQPLNRSLDATGANLSINWQLGEDLELQSITGYREYTSSFAGDYDASPVPVVNIYQTNEHEQISQELRLNGRTGDWLNWTVGAFYFDSDSTLTGRIGLGYVAFDFLHGPDPVETSNQAIFANGIIDITDALQLSVGLRYSEDEKIYTFARRNADLSAIETCVGPPGTPGNPPNCLISTLDGTIAPPFNDERVDYRTSLTYHINDNTNVYGSVSTGYKGGGVNPRPFYDAQVVTFDPEEMTTYEVGVKSEFFNNSLRVNAAYFMNDYTDIQLTLNDCTELFGPIFGAPCLANTNAGDAEVTGFEVEFDWAPINGLLIDGSYSDLDFEFTRLLPETGLPLSSQPAFTPETTWSLGAQYDIQIGDGIIRPRIDANYQDDVHGEANNTEGNLIESYTLINASIRWISPDETWSVALEGRNLSDEFYYLSTLDSTPSGGGTINASPGLPRTYMLTTRFNF